MGSPRIALLNAAHDAAPTSRNFRRELDATVREYNCPNGETPDGFAFDGFVVTGSRASVYWDADWIGRLKTWVGEAVQAGLPGLGVCFGHQLLADVLGGRVEGMGEYEIGYRTVFTTHSDRVVEAPPGATVIAENEYGIHGFRTGDVFTVQFHPEYDVSTARSVTRGKADELPAERIERVLADVHAENYREACSAKRLFDNFLEHVEDSLQPAPTR